MLTAKRSVDSALHFLCLSNSNPLGETKTQMWSDILWAGVAPTTIDRKPNTDLFELCKHSLAGQYFLWPQKKKEVRRKPGEEAGEACQVRLEDHLAVPTFREEGGYPSNI